MTVQRDTGLGSLPSARPHVFGAATPSSGDPGVGSTPSARTDVANDDADPGRFVIGWSEGGGYETWGPTLTPQPTTVVAGQSPSKIPSESTGISENVVVGTPS